MNLTGAVKRTAIRDLNRLVEIGILEISEELGRKRHYLLKSDIR